MSTDAGACCALCIGTICGCSFIGAAIAYIVFGIIFLIKDKHVCEDHSPLWTWCVVTIVLGAVSGWLAQNSQRKENPTEENQHQIEEAKGQKMFSALTSFTFSLTISVYGSVVFFGGYVCSNMKHTGLWTWAIIAYSGTLFTTFLYLLVFSCLCCGVALSGSSSPPPPEPHEYQPPPVAVATVETQPDLPIPIAVAVVTADNKV
jgi:H+/Cl- antiporter ClcA